MRSDQGRLVSLAAALACLVLTSTPMWPQQSMPQHPDAQIGDLNQAIHELQGQVRELRQTVNELRDESNRYRQETTELRHELESRMPAAPQLPVQQAPVEASRNSEGDRISKLEDDVQLLSGKVDEQYQTKVESASRYRVRLSGIVLFNMFSNRGTVDSIDTPSFAVNPGFTDSGGTFGGTLRQSLLGLEIFGPQFAGAKTSANIQFDFAGGFPNTLNGVSFGVMRLRTGTVRLDWTKTSIVAGQDALFFAPLSPTSFASLSTPALAYAGNLWAWTPQLRVEHRFALSDNSSLALQAGILDPFTGEAPSNEYVRQPLAGEKSGQPAYALHLGWSQKSDHGVKVGVGGYYSRQNWNVEHSVDGWAAIADWDVPLGSLFRLSGEFYRGRAVGGLGGGIGRSVVFNGPLTSPATTVLGLNSAGGWTQLKFTPAPRIEFNGAVGEDNPYAADLTSFPAAQSTFDPSLVRNRGGFANAIYRPRSDLVLSFEYRRIRTFKVPANSVTANQLNFAVGVLF